MSTLRQYSGPGQCTPSLEGLVLYMSKCFVDAPAASRMYLTLSFLAIWEIALQYMALTLYAVYLNTHRVSLVSLRLFKCAFREKENDSPTRAQSIVSGQRPVFNCVCDQTEQPIKNQNQPIPSSKDSKVRPQSGRNNILCT